jgi:hypothetical protein
VQRLLKWEAACIVVNFYEAVAFTMTERADQLHHDNAPAHSTALMQAFLAKHHHPGLSAPLHSRFSSLRLLAFPKAKIAVES